MPMTKAQEGRNLALGMLWELYFPPAPDGDGHEFRQDIPGNEIAANIEKLAQLGRTERWQTAIRMWAGAMRNADPDSKRWAFMQYGIYASHAIK